jgi:hypothetical protein
MQSNQLMLVRRARVYLSGRFYQKEKQLSAPCVKQGYFSLFLPPGSALQSAGFQRCGDQMQDDWLKERLAYLRGLKAPSDHQRLLQLLADKPDRTPEDERKLMALVRAEKAVERAQKAGANAARIVNAEKLAVRKARDRELYNAAGLMILACLVDSRTGMPVLDRGELLGALMELSRVSPEDERKAQWKRNGDALRAEKMKG